MFFYFEYQKHLKKVFFYFASLLLHFFYLLYDLIIMVKKMKDKKQAGEELKKENIFYYEAIGFFSILLSIIIVAKLGKIGKVLTILFKVSFGDWYLLIVFLIFIYGLYLVIQHRPFEFQNQKFIGYIICCIGLFILAHFSVHKYVLSSSGSYFKATWMYYKTFIQTGNDTYLGGGIIGGIIFYLIYSLLGSIGVLLISLFIVILGFTMIINKSLVDISHFFYKKIKNAKKYGKSFKRFFKYELGNNNYNKNQLSIYEKKKNLSLKLLDDYKNYSLFEEQGKRLIEQKSLIISIFHHYSLQYKEEKNNIGYSASLFIFRIYSSFDCQLIGNKLNDLLDEMVYLSRKNQKLQIEINHNNPMILSIKSLLMKQSVMKNNYLYK